MKTTKNYPKFNIIVTPEGLERVSILSVDPKNTLGTLEFYKSIAKEVWGLDKKIRRLRKTKKGEIAQCT